MFPITMTNVTTLSLRVVVETEVDWGGGGIRRRGEYREVVFFERSVVNLQTAMHS